MNRNRRSRLRNAALLLAASACNAAMAGYGGAVLTPSKLDFGAQPVQTVSASQIITVDVGTPGESLSITTLTIPAPFQRDGGTCPGAGAVTPPCTIGVRFAPQVLNEFNETLIVSAQVNGKPFTSSASLRGFSTESTDLSLPAGAVVFNQSAVTVGDQVTLSITPANGGPSSASGVRVRIQPAAELSLVGQPPSNGDWNCYLDKSGLACDQPTPKGRRGSSLPSLPPLVFLATAPANPANTIVIVSSEAFDGNGGNNQVVVPLVINGLVVDLEPSFSAVDDPVAQGGTLSFEGTVDNIGTVASSAGAQLKFDPTPDLAFAGATGSGWSCAPNSGFITCNNPAAIVAGGSSSLLRVNFTAPSAPTTINTLVEVLTADDNPGNNSKSIAVEVASNDFALSGTTEPSSGAVPFNAVVTLTGGYTGAGAGFGTTFQINATLPAGVSLIAVSPQSLWTCTPAGTNPVSCSFAATPQRVSLPDLQLNLRKTSSGVSTVPFVLSSNSPVADPNPANNTANIVLTGTGGNSGADVAIVKTASESSIVLGQSFQYRLNVQNSATSAAAATEVSVQDTLPAGLTLLGISYGSGIGSWSCNTSSPVQCGLNGTLPVGGAAPAIFLDVRYDASTPPSGGQISNTATVSASDVDPVTANNSSSVAVTVREPSHLRLSKTASRAQLSVGENLNFTLEVSNPGSSVATGLIVLDAVPAAFQVSAVQSDDFACTRSGNNVDCRTSNFEGGATGRIVIAATALSVGTQVNSANVTSAQGRTPVTASARVEVLAGALADLVISKRAQPGTVSTGQNVVYTIDVRNDGGSAANDVVIVDTLPQGIDAVGNVELAGATCTTISREFRCTLAAPLAPGAAVSARLTARSSVAPATGCQVIDNTATVSSSSAESSTGNNSSTASVSACAPGGTPLYDLVLRATPSTAQAGAGTFSILVSNTGSATYPGGPLTIDFGTTNLRLESIAPLGCSGDGAVVNCVLPPLQTSRNLTLTLGVRTTAQTAAAGQIRLTAASVEPGDASPADNTAVIEITRADTGIQQADLQLTARALTTDGLGGSTANFEFIASNLGPAAATGVLVVLDVPAGASVGNAQSAGATCTTNGNQVRCSANADLVRTGSFTIALGLRLPSAVGDAVVSGTVSSVLQDPVPGNNSASASTRVRIETATEVAAVLNNCAGNDRIAQISVDALARACADPNSPLQPLCRQLVASGGPQVCAEVREALSEIAPKDVLAQSLILRDFANTQFFNVDARLSDLRGGGGGFNLSGLNVQRGNSSMSFGTLQDLARAMRGDDSAEADDDAGYDSDLVSPWGFFANGTISSGEQDLNTDRYRVKADFESRGLTAGVDYRFKPNLVGGLAIGFAKFDADVSDASSLDTTATALTAYGSWYPVERLYVDARFSFGRASFDLNRRIDFSIGGESFSSTAVGDTDADQLTFAASVGHHYNVGGWNLTPSLAFRYVRSEVDAFTETGADMFNVAYGEQSVSSSQLALGMQVSRAFSLSHGILSPQFDVAFNRDFSDDDLVLEARLAGAGNQGVFQLREEDPDQNFGSVGLGFVYVTANGKQAYLSYRRLVGQSGVDRGTLNFGARFEF